MGTVLALPDQAPLSAPIPKWPSPSSIPLAITAEWERAHDVFLKGRITVSSLSLQCAKNRYTSRSACGHWEEGSAGRARVQTLIQNNLAAMVEDAAGIAISPFEFHRERLEALLQYYSIPPAVHYRGAKRTHVLKTSGIGTCLSESALSY